MLTNALRALVNNPFKEYFYRKKKTINLLQTTDTTISVMKLPFDCGLSRGQKKNFQNHFGYILLIKWHIPFCLIIFFLSF